MFQSNLPHKLNIRHFLSSSPEIVCNFQIDNLQIWTVLGSYAFTDLRDVTWIASNLNLTNFVPEFEQNTRLDSAESAGGSKPMPEQAHHHHLS